jgi:hypothetical protein
MGDWLVEQILHSTLTRVAIYRYTFGSNLYNNHEA